MNLDELKHIWQEQTASLEGYRLEEAELSSMLEGRSQTLLNKINRNILIEMGVVVVLTLVALLFMEVNRPSGVSNGELIGAFLYVGISGIFYGAKFRSLNKGRLRTYNLKSALTHIVKVMRVYMQIYYWASYTLPILVFGAGLYGLIFNAEAQGSSLADIATTTWISFTITFLIFGALCIFLMRLYVKWLYGKHYQELKTCLQELDEQP